MSMPTFEGAPDGAVDEVVLLREVLAPVVLDKMIYGWVD
jgi:hypothetical protein